MPKPSGGSSVTVRGTDGPDSLFVPAGRTLMNTAFDGGRGNDTLDLSGYDSPGVYVKLEYGLAKAKSSVAESPFTGTFAQFSIAALSRVEGSIRNVENLIGTAGNDFLWIHTATGSPNA